MPFGQLTVSSHPVALCVVSASVHFAERNASGTLINATPPPVVYFPDGAISHSSIMDLESSAYVPAVHFVHVVAPFSGECRPAEHGRQ